MATEARETVDLISSDKVEGTAEMMPMAHIGSIEWVMIEKRSGQVADAAPSFGGFMGIIGTDYYPIPGTPSSMTPALSATAPTLPRSSSKVRQGIRARVGTGTF